ncbi:saccharopine dehydrogenase NADP-binding domain-containing protein [Bacillus sp. A301a_S52]|nr:saccharopine dehydrogenase NADP-binding domain-containing protein [Bacillus sp. A301a_S52]
MKSSIVVIGGYGQTGRIICQALSDYYPGNVYAAGRNKKKAEAFSQDTDYKVRPFCLDINKMTDWDWLDSTKLVIVCLDLHSTLLADMCASTGTHYMDISSNGALFSKLKEEPLPPTQSTTLLSIGLAPGLTNLLAQRATDFFINKAHIDISIILGMGDTHGDAALLWTIKHLASSYHTFTKAGCKKIKSFSGRKKIDFGNTLGARSVYHFPFSDQQTLPNTLPVASVTTRLGFDSSFLTNGLALIRFTGLFGLLANERITAYASQFLKRYSKGAAIFAVKVDAYGTLNEQSLKKSILATGENESLITAKIAVAAGRFLYEDLLPPGTYHSDELFSLTDTGDTLSLKLKSSSRVEPITSIVRHEKNTDNFFFTLS